MGNKLNKAKTKISYENQIVRIETILNDPIGTTNLSDRTNDQYTKLSGKNTSCDEHITSLECSKFNSGVLESSKDNVFIKEEIKTSDRYQDRKVIFDKSIDEVIHFTNKINGNIDDNASIHSGVIFCSQIHRTITTDVNNDDVVLNNEIQQVNYFIESIGSINTISSIVDTTSIVIEKNTTTASV